MACKRTRSAKDTSGAEIQTALALDATGPFQIRALKEGRTIVFCDQSGFYLLPMVVRTYAPLGKTPILHEPFETIRHTISNYAVSSVMTRLSRLPLTGG